MCLKSKFRKRIKVDADFKIELTKPRSVAIRNLCSKSLSQTFDEAKLEWILTDVIDETCDGFVDTCELCHTKNLKYNFVLYNPKTNQTLRVGTTCIIRFRLVKGIVDVESGISVLQKFVDEQMYINQLQTEVASMMVLHPDAKSLMIFHKNLKKVMELKGINNPTVDQIGEICYGPNWKDKSKDQFVFWRLKTIWENPGSIETIKSKPKIANDCNDKDIMWYKKRRPQVYHLGAGRSKIYKVEKEVLDK